MIVSRPFLQELNSSQNSHIDGKHAVDTESTDIGVDDGMDAGSPDPTEFFEFHSDVSVVASVQEAVVHVVHDPWIARAKGKGRWGQRARTELDVGSQTQCFNLASGDNSDAGDNVSDGMLTILEVCQPIVGGTPTELVTFRTH